MTVASRAKDQIGELLSYLFPDERAQLERAIQRTTPKPKGKAVPADWRLRVPEVFPRYASAPFAGRHAELWDWANAIEIDSSPRPFCAFWPRGGAKSTSAEMVATDLGCRGKRRYIVYIRMTQDKADMSVANIAALLESPEVARHYPDHAKRKVGLYGSSKGWRRNRLWTAGNLAVDALGIDTASRGVKLEEQRPDLFVFDDIDDLLDSPAITRKKTEIITKSILPAGSNNVAVLYIQNLIIRDGVASQLADGRADFLSNRIVSGPFPAVEGLKYAWQVDKDTGMRVPVITAGRATWAGQSIEACQKIMQTIGPSAFLKECQHKVQGRAEGVALRFDVTRHYLNPEPTDDKWIELVQKSRAFGGIDFGSWRFGFSLWITTPAGVVIKADEIFSQKESLLARAKKIHEMCLDNGIDEPSPKTCPIWGDSANPTDIMEINLAFRNGWDDEETGKHVTSKLRVIAVGAEGKLRKTAVERINNALDHNRILFRRGPAARHQWMLGMNAGNEGTAMTCSRLMWEIDNWAVAVPKEGEAQDDDPDDDTADGADLVASMRYALMSHWRAPKPPADAGIYEHDRGWEFDYKKSDFKEPPHVKDLLDGTAHRRRPAIHGVRPRVRR